MEILKRGIMAGFKTAWALGKVIFPITLFITILKYTPALPWLTKLIEPLMGLIGLPGDAALALVLGNFLNLYAAIGAILTLELTVKEVFILAVMLSFSHNILVESSVAARVGVRISIVLGVRLGLAVLSAVAIHLLWDGGSEAAQYGLASARETAAPSGWADIVWQGIYTAGMGVFQLALVVLPLMVAIQFLKELGFLEQFSRLMSPATKLLGMKENTSTTLAAGLLFGLAFGAGVMIQAVREDGVEKKDLVLAFIFLVACHAVVEDTLIFIPLGIPVLPLFMIRLCVAVLLTMIVSIIWRRMERKGLAYEN
ncbi:MAG: nucleoside recognition domain-containing protein [Ectobacillus sp.]